MPYTPVFNTFDIDFTHVTEVELEGEGWFDQLMRATRAQLGAALDSNSITQDGYGETISKVIPSLVQEAIKFELSGYQLEIDNLLKAAEIALLEQSIDISAREMDEYEKTKNKETELMEAKAAKSAFDIALMRAKVLTEKENTTLTENKGYTVTAETALLADQILSIDAQNRLTDAKTVETGANRLLVAAKYDTEAEKAKLVTKQAASAVSNTNYLVAQNETELANAQFMARQILKLSADSTFIDQQAVTENERAGLVYNQTDAVVRKRQSYDDSVQIEMVKQQGAYAAFAVNSGSSDEGVQTAIDNLKTMIDTTYSRASSWVSTQSADLSSEPADDEIGGIV